MLNNKYDITLILIELLPSTVGPWNIDWYAISSPNIVTWDGRFSAINPHKLSIYHNYSLVASLLNHSYIKFALELDWDSFFMDLCYPT